MISKSLELTKALVARRFFSLIALFALSSFLIINLEDFVAGLDPREENLRLITHLFLALWDGVEGFFLLLLLSWAIPEVFPLKGERFLKRPFERPYLTSYFAEYLRVLGQVLLWGILLILPGFIRYLRLIFVPFIVFFSSDYDKDEVDALELSAKLVKSVFWPIAAMVIGTGAVQLGIELLVHFQDEFHALPVRLTLDAVSFLISVWSYSFIMVLFPQQMEKHKWT